MKTIIYSVLALAILGGIWFASQSLSGDLGTPKPTHISTISSTTSTSHTVTTGTAQDSNLNQIKETKVPLRQGELVIKNLVANQAISSPLKLTGSAPGTWYFEGSFGVQVVDANGKILASVPAQAVDSDSWMTEGPVAFARTISFKTPTTPTGFIVFSKDNPSDIRSLDESYKLPVTFAEFATRTTQVKAFLTKAGEATTDYSCSKVYPVTRTVAQVPAIGKATLIELLAGPTPSEISSGYSTQLNPFISLNSLTIKDGVAYADFNETLDFQIGGSCRVGYIRAQITQTLLQFPTIKSVVISRDGQIEDILQP